MDESNQCQRTPKWVWGLMFVMALIQPFLGLCEWRFPPEGYRYTGLPIPDSVIFLRAMEIPEKGLVSAYASPGKEAGGIAYFAVPHLWFYAAQGLVAQVMRIPVEGVYFAFNGIGAFLFLCAAWRLIRLLTTKDKWAKRSFLLFCLGGGAGGLFLWISVMMGGAQDSGFAVILRRFGMYELMEGPHLTPHTLFARSYYTFSLALCFAGMEAFIRWIRGRERRLPWISGILVLLGGLINARYGVFCAGLCLLPVLFERRTEERQTLSLLKGYSLIVGACVIGLLVAEGFVGLNPATKQNHYDAGGMAMWFMPFVVATGLLWILSVRGLLREPGRLGIWGAGLAGLLIAYSLLYVAYQVYYGTGWRGAEAGVAGSVSDWALLIGFMVGGVVWAKHRNKHGGDRVDWVWIWLLGVVCVSLGGFGQGWFLNLGPQRAQVLIWLPLCILAGRGIGDGSRAAGAVFLGAIICGLVSIAGSFACVQGPWAYARGVRLFPETRCDVIKEQDCRVLEMIPVGKRVIAPLPAADVAYVMRGAIPVFAYGSFNLADVRHRVLEEETGQFFAKGIGEERRQQIIRERRVEYVWCPVSWGLYADIEGELRQMRGLRVVGEEKGGLLFHVEQ